MGQDPLAFGVKLAQKSLNNIHRKRASTLTSTEDGVEGWELDEAAIESS